MATMEFVVPQGATPGQQLTIATPTGNMQVMIPPAAKPGQKLQLAVPVTLVKANPVSKGPAPDAGMQPVVAGDGANQVQYEQASLEDLIRAGFIKKTYSILCVQLIVTFGLMFVIKLTMGPVGCEKNTTGHTVCEDLGFILRNRWVYYVAMACSIGAIIALFCCGNNARIFPRNYGLMAILTVAQGVMLGVVSIFYQTDAIVFACIMTVVVVVGLTIYAATTKSDFTDKGGYICAAGLVFFCLLIFVPIFYKGGIIRLLLAGAGCLIFSLFIVYDTQLIVGGQHKKYAFGVDDYCFAAVNLYLDVINLFYMVLALTGGGGGGGDDN